MKLAVWILFSPAVFFLLAMFLILGLWRELGFAEAKERDTRLGKWLAFHGRVR